MCFFTATVTAATATDIAKYMGWITVNDKVDDDDDDHNNGNGYDGDVDTAGNDDDFVVVAVGGDDVGVDVEWWALNICQGWKVKMLKK